MTPPERGMKVLQVPVYWMGLIVLGIAGIMWLTYATSVAKSEENTRDLIARYEADKQATAAQNKGLICALFGSQLAAFEDAQSPAGKQSYQAWLDLYRLQKCLPVR